MTQKARDQGPERGCFGYRGWSTTQLCVEIKINQEASLSPVFHGKYSYRLGKKFSLFLVHIALEGLRNGDQCDV